MSRQSSAPSRAALLAAVALTLPLGLAACGGPPPLPPEATYGPNPTLVEPHGGLFPTVKIADVVGWRDGAMPTPAAGLRVQPFASGLDHPRWLYTLPNGDVLVAESTAPPRPKGKEGGLKGWVQGLFMKKAGAVRPSADRLTLLRDADGDGLAETRTAFLTGLRSPIGMALVGDQLYVANADAVVAVPYQTGQTQIAATPRKVADLPAGRNHHWTKSLVASPDGSRLYVGVGSNSNIGENGLDEEADRAAVLEIDPATGARRVYASGLRNPVGMAWNATSGMLWVSVNERDEIGDDLVPDYMTSVRPGGFYGWPWSYYGNHVDERVKPANSAMVGRAIKPDYALGAHTASLGLGFYEADLMPGWRGSAVIGQHGSWNRSRPNGYRVIRIAFADGKPTGMPQEVLTGFLDGEGRAQGRPVGVATDARGALLVADDVGNVVWRVSPSAP